MVGNKVPDEAMGLLFPALGNPEVHSENSFPLPRLQTSHFLSLVSATSPHAGAAKPKQFNR
jgi:hypothetical protein